MNDDDGPSKRYRRPEGLDDATVEALGKLSEALEIIEHARGHLYAFHRLTGKADFALGDAAELLRQAGHHELAKRIEEELVGRNVIEGRWTFQIIDEYDETYYSPCKELELQAREKLAGGRKHLFEAEMKEERRTHGLKNHEATAPSLRDLES
ncbi:MAG TPA: hypothetical protein VN601_09160 [Arthrobacter sp.]|nr:hypothetical protein [Arthrobacter sp.]